MVKKMSMKRRMALMNKIAKMYKAIDLKQTRRVEVTPEFRAIADEFGWDASLSALKLSRELLLAFAENRPLDDENVWAQMWAKYIDG